MTKTSAAAAKRLTTYEVAERLRVSPRTVRGLFSDGKIPGEQLPNGRILFAELDVERFTAAESRWLTAGQVAEQLGVTARAVRGFVHSGTLKAHTLPRSRDRYRFRQSDVDRLLRKHSA